MSSIAVPNLTGLRNRRGLMYVTVPGVVIAALLLATFGRKWFVAHEEGIAGSWYSVIPMDMDVKVTKDGELQAVNNIDIMCQVEGSTTIQELVKEGTYVKKGDLLCKLDSSAIETRIEDATMDVQRGEADLATANEMKLIQESQNAANLEAAEVALQLARIDLQQYTEGTYPQSLVSSQTDLDMAQVQLKNKQEDYDQINKLYEKGFVTAGDVKRAELDVRTAQVNLRKAQTALDVLTQYTNAMDLATKKNTLVQAEARLARVQRENVANLAQQIAGVKAKEETLDMQKRRLAKLKDQFAACTIEAPAEGLVVYASTLDRYASVQIQEGAQVRERQLILRLPDTGSMKAVIRVPEAQQAKLNVGQRATVAIVGYPKPLTATLTKISVLSDSSGRWWNPDLKEYPVDLTLDQTPPNLKPGTSAQCEVYIDRLKNVLAVPLTCIYAAGKDTYVFTRSGLTARPVKVALGKTNETHAEITSGLTPGQSVLILAAGQGRELLEKAGIKVEDQATTRPSDEKANQRRQSPPASPAAPSAASSNGAKA